MKCEICGDEISGGSAFTCNYCGGTFCPSHRLPFNHSCKNLTEWKKSGLPGKKEVGKIIKIRPPAIIPFYKKKEIIIAGIIIVALIIIAWVLFFS